MTTTTILYTHHIDGALNRLPRYATALRRRRRDATGDVLLLDLGDACVPTSEPCALTDGRAVPIVLDAMGYAAIYVGGYLTDATRDKLRANTLATALVDDAHPYITDTGIAFGVEPPPAHPHRFHIATASGDAVALSDGPTLNDIYTLTLRALAAWEIGVVEVALGEMPQIIRASVEPVDRKTPPDATIAGTVDFVMDEVRLLKRTRGGSG
ncbi:MAG: hypothetical protein AAF125_09425 [Chloroflexota bacterium]